MSCHPCHTYDHTVVFFLAGTYSALPQMLLLQHELAGWVKLNGGLRGEPLQPLNSVQSSLSKELRQNLLPSGTPMGINGEFLSETHVSFFAAIPEQLVHFALINLPPKLSCAASCLLKREEGVGAGAKACSSGLPGSAPHHLGDKSTHASAPRLPPSAHQPHGPACSGTAVSTVHRLMVAISLPIDFLLEKFLPDQMLLSKHQGQSCACFAPSLQPAFI